MLLEQLPTAPVIDLRATAKPSSMLLVYVACPWCRRGHMHSWLLGVDTYPVRPSHCAISRPYRLIGLGMPTLDTLKAAATA